MTGRPRWPSILLLVGVGLVGLAVLISCTWAFTAPVTPGPTVWLPTESTTGGTR